MTALRTNEGIDLSKVESRYGAAAVTGLLNAAQSYIATDKIKVEKSYSVV
jgi:coproporphyrinogen III oxidase-like Fe-S oxidoreductase